MQPTIIVASKNRPKLLSDHQRIGKRLIPPAARLGMTEIHYVERILPEIVWIGFLLESAGVRKGIELAGIMVETCYRLKAWTSQSEFCLISNYLQLTSLDWSTLKTKLMECGVFSECVNALSPFVRCYPKGNPFINLLDNDPSNTKIPISDISLARRVVSNIFDRRCKQATLVQSVVLWMDIKLGKYHIPIGYPFHDFETIFGDLESEAISEAAPHVRMHLNATHMFYASSIGETWSNYFWNRGKDLVPLQPNNIDHDFKIHDDLHPVIKFARDYEVYAWTIVDSIWSQLPVDIYESEFFEVIGALLARQCNLAVKIASNIDLWDYHAGPLFLRPMTDCCITVAWILQDRLDRARKFILHGLGQEKLQIERLKTALPEYQGEELKMLEQQIYIREEWLNNQHFAFLQHVDLGSWSGISTRKMAEEAGKLNLYDFAYVGWSHSAHGTWNHIGKFDSLPSPESLHKHIWQPCNLEHGAHVDVVIQATKYFDEFCVSIVEDFQLAMDIPRPNEWLMLRLQQFDSEMKSLDEQIDEPTQSTENHI